VVAEMEIGLFKTANKIVEKAAWNAGGAWFSAIINHPPKLKTR
jgi:hypothetical protein